MCWSQIRSKVYLIVDLVQRSRAVALFRQSETQRSVHEMLGKGFVKQIAANCFSCLLGAFILYQPLIRSTSLNTLWSAAFAVLAITAISRLTSWKTTSTYSVFWILFYVLIFMFGGLGVSPSMYASFLIIILTKVAGIWIRSTSFPTLVGKYWRMGSVARGQLCGCAEILLNLQQGKFDPAEAAEALAWFVDEPPTLAEKLQGAKQKVTEPETTERQPSRDLGEDFRRQSEDVKQTVRQIDHLDDQQDDPYDDQPDVQQGDQQDKPLDVLDVLDVQEDAREDRRSDESQTAKSEQPEFTDADSSVKGQDSNDEERGVPGAAGDDA